MKLEKIVTDFILRERVDVLYYGGLDTLVKACIEGYRSTKLTSYKYRKFTKAHMPNKERNTRPYTYIAESLGLKYCSKCTMVLPVSEFRLNSATARGVQTECKPCHQKSNDKTQTTRQAVYRAGSATPPWFDKEKVDLFYSRCPAGFHVDHVIPLNHPKVCGLHTLINLQYLTEADNLEKGNRLEIN